MMFHHMEQVETYFKQRSGLGIQPGLERMYVLLESQQHPEQYLKAIHIAGTNGKGSTATFLKAALQQNGYRVGVFTSPSMSGITGHIIIDDQPIDENQFLKLFNNLLPTIEKLDLKNMPPTEFEIITAIALMYFQKQTDFVIIETGMGGREDATNCIQPLLSIITNIAKDHASFLGDTVEEIAYQKAGIIKQGIPTVLGNIEDPSLSIIQAEAQSKNSTIYRLHNDYYFQPLVTKTGLFKWYQASETYEVEICMHGQHQFANASIALMALKVLSENHLSLNWKKVIEGMKVAQLAGRFEKVHEHPIIIVDGAHNPAGMEAFLETLESIYGNYQKRLIFAGFRDKELPKMVEMALPYFEQITITSFEHPRAESADSLIARISFNELSSSDWKEEIKRILANTDKRDTVYCFAGSLHFISLLRDYVKQRKM